MLIIKLFFCFAAAIVIFSGVESIRTFEHGVKLTCEQICQGYLSGKTYICEMTGIKEKATTVIRIVPHLNWRFYVIPKLRPKSVMCQRIAAADALFINGGKQCPSALRSEKDQVDHIDPSNLQSSHRAEDIKRLLKELNRNTVDVLNDLKASWKSNGLTSSQFSLNRHKKMKMKLFLEELVEFLSFYGWLRDDIKYHQKNSRHPSNSIQPSETGQFGPDDQQGPGGYPNSFGRPKPLGRPGQFGETGQFGPNDQQGPGGYPNSFGRPKPLGRPGQFGETGQFGPNDQQGPGGYSNSFGRPKPLGRPGQFGETDQFGPNDQQGPGGYPNSFGRPKPLGRPGQFGETSQFGPNDQQGPGGYSSSFGRPKPVSGTNQPSNPCNPNNEGHAKPSIFSYSLYPCKNHSSGVNFGYYNPRPQEEPKNIYNYILKANRNNEYTTYNDRANYNYRNMGTRAEDPSQADEVKKLALRLNEETSKALKQLEDGSSDGIVKKRNLFTSVLDHLEAFVNLIFNTDGYDLLEQIWNDNLLSKDTSKTDECILCTIVLRDICKDRMLVACNESYCCWKSYDPLYCKTAQTDKTADKCYNNLINILLSSRLM